MRANNLLKKASQYHYLCNNIFKYAKIRKLPSGKYRVVSRRKKNLGTYKSKTHAKKRLKQVEYFKHIDKNYVKDKIDLESIDEFSLSCILRELNKMENKKPFKRFLSLYKKNFDKLIKNKTEKPYETALDLTFIKFNTIYDVNFSKKISKNAQQASLGTAEDVGRYLANIVLFMLQRISPSKRQGSINKLKRKFYNLNEGELAMKKMPASSAMGQSITFIKTVLFNHNPKYIREIINNLIKFLPS